MIIVDCPHCKNDVMLKLNEISNFISKGKTDSECYNCGNIFEVYSGKDKIESRIKEDNKNGNV